MSHLISEMRICPRELQNTQSFEPLPEQLLPLSLWHGWQIVKKSVENFLFPRTFFSSINELPTEIHLSILHYLDLGDLDSLRRTDRYWNLLVVDDSIWRAIAQEVGCNITEGIPVYKQVLHYFEIVSFKLKYMQKVTQRSPQLRPIYRVPARLQDFFHTRHAASIADFRDMTVCMCALDTISVWNRVFIGTTENQLTIAQRDTPYPWELEREGSFTEQELKDFSDQFSIWCTVNKESLSRFTDLFLCGSPYTGDIRNSFRLFHVPPEIFTHFSLRSVNLNQNLLFSFPIDAKTSGILVKLIRNPLTTKNFLTWIRKENHSLDPAFKMKMGILAGVGLATAYYTSNPYIGSFILSATTTMFVARGILYALCDKNQTP